MGFLITPLPYFLLGTAAVLGYVQLLGLTEVDPSVPGRASLAFLWAVLFCILSHNFFTLAKCRIHDPVGNMTGLLSRLQKGFSEMWLPLSVLYWVFAEVVGLEWLFSYSRVRYDVSWNSARTGLLLPWVAIAALTSIIHAVGPVLKRSDKQTKTTLKSTMESQNENL